MELKAAVSNNDIMRILIAVPWRADCQSLRLIRSLIPEDQAAEIVWFGPPGSQFGHRLLAENLFAIEPFPGCRPANSILYRAGFYHHVQDFLSERRITQLAAKLKQLIIETKPDLVWGLGHDSHVPILYEAIRDLRVPLHLSVHDEPVSYARRNSCWPDRKAVAVERTWPLLLARASSIDCVSRGMQDQLKNVYKRESMLCMPCPRYPLITDRTRPPINDEIRIGLSGSDNAVANVRRLIEGLYAWRQNSRVRAIEIVWLAGTRLNAPLPPAITVDVTGFLDEKKAIEHLRACHILYLPYPFDDAYEVARRTAFPSKLSMYLPACRPILFHAPENSTLIEFSRRHAIGAEWIDLDPAVLPALMDRLLGQAEDDSLETQYSALLDSDLNAEQNRSILWSALGQAVASERRNAVAA